MFEKVNMYHPDKVADRIAGALVDLAYAKSERPKVAVEVLIGHGKGLIINETDTPLDPAEVEKVVKRIAGKITYEYKEVAQDKHLAGNQKKNTRCGDNGIFKGVIPNKEEYYLAGLAKRFADWKGTDGKYLIDEGHITICQSHLTEEEAKGIMLEDATINPLGYWEGGIDVDSGATNRKLGSDMGRGATGGGLHGKDLSKADVSVNIECFLTALELREDVYASCEIGDQTIVFKSEDGEWLRTMDYEDVVKEAKEYIDELGGFEKFAEEGLIRG